MESYYDNSHFCANCNGDGCRQCEGKGVTRWPLFNVSKPPCIAQINSDKAFYNTSPRNQIITNRNPYKP